jgi:hypothetical protein
MLAAGIAALVVGLVLGLVLGGGDENTDPLKGLRDARSSFRQAATVLDIVPVEYGEGVENRRVVSEPEYQGAVGAISRSRELYAEGRPVLAYVDSQEATRIDRAYEGLSRAAAARAPENAVESAAERLAAMVEGAIEGG